MRLPRSLAVRLVLVLALVQSGTVVAGMAAWMIFSPYVTWVDVAHRSASGLVLAALERGADGAPALRMTEALGAYAAARPGFGFAALVDGRPAGGSSPEVAAAVARFGPLLPREGQLEAATAEGRSLRLSALPGPEAFGDAPVIVATTGDRFRADDLPAFVGAYLPALVPLFGPAVVAAAIVLPLAIGITLRPVGRAAREAELVTLDTLDRRLPEDGAPSELAPFIAAINRLLARLQDGVARQRVFVANAAHELRTPVAVIQARLDGLAEGSPARDELLRDLRRITVLLDQLLSVARLGQRNGTGATPLDLVACTRRLVSDCAPLAIRSGRALAFEADEASMPAHGDEGALEGAIAALIENALEAEPPGGTVLVRVGPGPMVIVRDHGRGIPPADREAVFEPFWRGREGGRGTGLGLAIVREVARLHRGEVDVSETPGGGATFALRLPPPPSGRGQVRAMTAG
jgi:signal transduction histidine kinase